MSPPIACDHTLPDLTNLNSADAGVFAALVVVLLAGMPPLRRHTSRPATAPAAEPVEYEPVG